MIRPLLAGAAALALSACATPPPIDWIAVWEAFKVYDGQIWGVEAFLEQMDPNMGNGWEWTPPEEPLTSEPATPAKP